MDDFHPLHIHWKPRRDGGAPLIRDEQRALSSADFAAEVAGLALLFVQKGVGRGDVVATMLPNRIDIVVAMFAAWRIGAAFMPINPALTSAEALYQVADSGSRLILVDAAARDRLTGTTATLLPVDAPPERSAAVLPDAAVAADDTALLIYTSGTTGRPKGVMLSHGNIDAMLHSIHAALRLDGDLSLLVMPLFHVNALLVSILAPLAAGGGACILEHFDRHSFWQSVRDSGANYFSGVPAMYLLLTAERGAIAPAPRLRFAICGAAPMPAQAIGAFEARYAVPVLEGYGLTESTVGATLNPLDGPRRPGSVGRADRQAAPLGIPPCRRTGIRTRSTLRSGVRPRPDRTGHRFPDIRRRAGSHQDRFEHPQMHGCRQRLRQVDHALRPSLERQARQILAVQQHLAPCGLEQSRHGFEQRRFAAAVGPQQRDHVARLQGPHRQVPDDGVMAVGD